MKQKIEIRGYSVGDNSVGIPPIGFAFKTGLEELSKEDREYLKRLIREIWELHDNGTIVYHFSDEDSVRKFTQKDSKQMLSKYRSEFKDLEGIDFLRDLIKWCNNTPEHLFGDKTANQIFNMYKKSLER